MSGVFVKSGLIRRRDLYPWRRDPVFSRRMMHYHAPRLPESVSEFRICGATAGDCWDWIDRLAVFGQMLPGRQYTGGVTV